MKKEILFIVLVIIIGYGNLYSQKHDYHWKFGYTQLDDPDNTRWGSTAMDFNKYYESDFIQLGGSSFIDFENTCAIISDSEGNYLFSYNGIYIEDAAFNVMENGNNMSNSGDNYGDIMPSGAIVLPVPESSHLYALFHIEWGYYYDPDLVIRGKHLYYSVIDMEKNSRLGAVAEKKRILLSDEVRFDTKIATTRHANGRDWWLLIFGYDTEYLSKPRKAI